MKRLVEFFRTLTPLYTELKKYRKKCLDTGEYPGKEAHISDIDTVLRSLKKDKRDVTAREILAYERILSGPVEGNAGKNPYLREGE